MSSYRKLINNSLVFGIGNMGSKIITFIMLPLYTYALSTSEYGTVDLMLITTSLLLPIVGLSIFESVLRFAMDKKNNPKSVFSNSLYVTMISSVIIIALLPIIGWYKLDMLFLPLLLIIQLFQNLFSQYAKAINKINLFAMNGIILSFSTALLNIFFLITLDMGLPGYLISLLLANFISTIYLALKLNIFSLFDRDLVKKSEIIEQLQFSIPLIPNSIAWWLTTAIGRYFILILLGSSANGIFAISNKIPTLLTVFTSIFSQSWQISAIEEYENDNSKDLLGNVYNYYFFLLFLGTSLLILFIKPLMGLLVSSNFFESWKYVPFLLISVIFSSVSSFLGAQYVAMKDTLGVFKTTVLGSILNIVLNILLIPRIGLQGVGVSSFLSFFLVWIIRHININRYYDLNLKKSKIYCCLILVIIQSLLSIFNLSMFLQIIILLFISYLYWKDIKILCLLFYSKIINKVY